MQPKTSKVARVPEIPKVDKSFERVPSFRPITYKINPHTTMLENILQSYWIFLHKMNTHWKTVLRQLSEPKRY